MNGYHVTYTCFVLYHSSNVFQTLTSVRFVTTRVAIYVEIHSEVTSAHASLAAF